MPSQPNRVRTAAAVDRRCRRNPTGHSVSARSAVPRCCRFVFCLFVECAAGWNAVLFCFGRCRPSPQCMALLFRLMRLRAALSCALWAYLLAEEGAVGQNLQALWTVEDLAGQRRPIRDSAGRSGIAVKCSGARQETFKGTQRGYMLCALRHDVIVPLRQDAMRLLYSAWCHAPARQGPTI